MSSIGPQLPPHLAKRKRTPDDEGADSPPAKQSRNTDEIDLEDDSDNDSFSHSVNGRATVAAAASRPSPSSTPSIGAALLPSNPTNTSEIPLDDSDSEDGYGPSAPRITSTAEVPKNKPSIGPAPPPKQTIGPAMPPPNHRGADDDNNSSSDSDDDYGPALPSSTTSAQRVQAAAAAAAAQASAGPVAPQRDDWMLAPPTQSGYHERDPTKLKNRKFASSKSSTAAGGGAGGISSIWTETPEQKRKRLEDAVLGRGDATSAAGPQQPRRTKEEEERDRRISENIATARGRSMYEEHQRSKKGGVSQCKGEEEEDDPSKRAFDREKDMSLGGKIGTAQRKELLNRAKDFGGRFQKGSYL
ncbi:hypothetical protein LY78DRAFT_652795 [Colletotrichum sublineola]|uniref:DUF3752 domain-containing protein n=1 Tax=Colletotrichum sublineola TaxID=1173701 RepID=A0A066XRD7_COLSU|nr:hypothetical protein LY78DRAFT_652795 [Colletotrichum sublineola]KDN68316.1 hypothetical protein CSUB01_10850 [Colletotrichum sublineola]